ncbi:MAG: molybdenum cofactor biosynthesis protein MoaE [Janthinobacterium lividum]
MASVSVQAVDYDVAAEIAAMTAKRTDIGAVVTFSGLCRDDGGTLEALEIEHYPGMAEGEIGRVCAEAETRWPLQGCRVIHRYGAIKPGEAIVLVVTASAHRVAAFAAADFLMDYLKSEAPFWKRNRRRDAAAPADWVAPKEADATALDRWL